MEVSKEFTQSSLFLLALNHSMDFSYKIFPLIILGIRSVGSDRLFINGIGLQDPVPIVKRTLDKNPESRKNLQEKSHQS